MIIVNEAITSKDKDLQNFIDLIFKIKGTKYDVRSSRADSYPDKGQKYLAVDFSTDLDFSNDERISIRRPYENLTITHLKNGVRLVAVLPIKKSVSTPVNNSSKSGWRLEVSNVSNDKNPKIINANSKNDAAMKYDYYSRKYKYVHVFDGEDFIDPTEL